MVRGATRKTRWPKSIVVFLLLALAGAGWFFIPRRPVAVEPASAELASEPAVQPSTSPSSIIGETDHVYEVQDGDTFSDIFLGQEIPYGEIVSLEQTESDVFSFRKVQAGKKVFMNFYEEGSDLRLKDVYYQPDLSRVVHAQQTSGGWLVEEIPVVYETREATATGSVEGSLYLSALAAGVDERAILAFADVFAWDIDFALQTRSGDTYKMIFEEKYLDNELVTAGNIIAAEYVNNGERFRAYAYRINGQRQFFDEEGNAMQKAFLKAPVNYRNVTSGFSSARFHPIIGQVMPHNGVDYAAAVGTPIIAVADGVVSKMGWMGGYGNRIELKHGDRYGSQYSHMSAYVKGMQVGQQVTQGEVVGYVGSTGYSTGPHVHYSMTDRGSYVDPEKVDVPDGEPIPTAEREAYLQLVSSLTAQLESM